MEHLHITDHKTPKFTFANKKYFAKCVKVYDGDTCWCTFAPFPDHPVQRFVIRMCGYNSAEIKGGSEKEHNTAVIARDELARLILHKIVVLDVVGEDKYGRLLARVVCDGVDINAHMLANKFGFPYAGSGEKLWE